MSDEEKKAIEYVKNIKSWWWDNSPNRIYSINRTDIEQFDIVLNLTERQQKEIEELKEKNKILEAISLSFKEIQDRDKKWEDKIKAKIGRIEDLHLSEDYKDYVISVLQSLLEKE